MKKLIIILLIINSMGFTTDKDQHPATNPGQGLAKAVNQQYGYLEVTSTANYSITISGN